MYHLSHLQSAKVQLINSCTITLTMSGFDFTSLKFENMSEREEDTYSVFITESDEGRELVMYDAMGDPLIETKIADSEWDEVKKLFDECSVSDWDGFGDFDETSMESFSLEAEDAEGNILWAEGAGSFPDGFERFRKGLASIFEGYLA